MDKLGQWFATFHRIRPCFCCVSVRCRLGVAMGLSLLATNGAAEISLELVAEGFTQPVYLTHAADKRLFVVEQPGRIVQFVPSGTGTRVFLDIRKRVRSAGNEQGPLSVAFHPQFARNGRLFVNDTKAGGTTVVAEFSAGAARATAQPSSERVILEVKQPHGNHNDGQLQFGPDGFLYIGMGDGGAGGDPRGAGQNQRTLLGAMLRIDIDGKHPYAIPGSIPYAQGAGRDEICAIGLRNLSRYSFDRKSGDLYIADVGKNKFEEVNWQPTRSRGGENYGCNPVEAESCFYGRGCPNSGLTAPIAHYSHALECSITGGYVYRGSRVAGLTGRYVYGDFCSGTISSLDRGNGSVQVRKELFSGLNISSFGEDGAGELYVLHLGGTVPRVRGG